MSSKKTDFNLTIESQSLFQDYLKELFLFRELFYFLAWRDILVRYKQAFFGISWAVIRPILNMLLFTLLFGRIAKLPSDHVHYSLFVLAGLIPWLLFSNSVNDCSNSLIVNSPLITKIYFPRLMIPMSTIAVHIVDFCVGAVLLFFLAITTRTLDYYHLLILPFFIALTLFLSLGVGMWLSALTVRYRDFRFIVPFAIQLGMFLSPVGYGSFLISSEWKWAYFCNPMVGIIDGFRLSIFGIFHPDFYWSVGISFFITFFLFFTGFFYFRKTERICADII